MFEKPVFKPKFQVEVINATEVLLIDEQGNSVGLTGRIYSALAPFLRKGAPIDAMIKKMGKKFSEPEIFYALLRLKEKGVVEEAGNHQLSRPLAAFASSLGVETGAAEELLKRKKISVFALGEMASKKVERSLRRLSICLAPEGGLAVIVADDYLDPEICSIAEQMEERGTPWLLAKITGSQIWLGPFFSPEKKGGYKSLQGRLEANSQEKRVVGKKGEEWILSSPPSLATNTDIGLSLLGNEILKWIWTGKNPNLENQIQTFDSISMTWRSHALLLPQSEDQKEQKSDPPPPLQLRRFPLSEKVAPEATWNRFQHIISPLTGIVRFLEPISKQQGGLHVFGAAYTTTQLERFVERPFMDSKNHASGGKGKTEAQAKASCLCEAIERYSGVYQGSELRKRASFNEWGPHEAIHPNRAQNFSERQQSLYEQLNVHAERFHQVPRPFDKGKAIDWSPIWSLTERRHKWVPTSYCYYNMPGAREEKLCWADSNGCAAGNTLEEAILQGFFELVERDSIALWWYNRLKRPGVDVKSFEDPYLNRLVQYYGEMGREIWAIDLTFDLGLPTFAAVSRKRGGEREEQVVMGFGTHFDPQTALVRAFTELNQLLPAFENLEEEVSLTKWSKSVSILEHPYLAPSPTVAAKRMTDYPSISLRDSIEAIDFCRAKVEEKNMEMLVLDQTRPEIGLPVVKVIVPGLRHMWNRFGPGRLYDVPVQLGLLDRPLTEDELNPLYMFL